MNRESMRRVVTLFLLVLLALAALQPTPDPKSLALTLSAITALLMRVVRFYFPRRGMWKESSSEKIRMSFRLSDTTRTKSGRCM